MKRFSILDLSPIPEGGTAGDALRNTLDLAQAAEAQGYHRFWLAEHHNMPGIASSATAVMIGQVARVTSSIRVGSGGVMLPNHSPLMVAEQFGTLATLFPGRIDLGLGRAPGTDMQTARALRKHSQGAEFFPNDVVELLGYLAPSTPEKKVRAIPGEGTEVPIWILGSSLSGAQLAGHLGLPYAFASHFAPQLLAEALHVYRSHFQPSRWLDQPYVMIGAGCYAAETDDEAHFLRSSHILGFAQLRTGRPGKLPRPVSDLRCELPDGVISAISEDLSVSLVGGPGTLREQAKTLIDQFAPDELILTAGIHDPAKRVASYAIAAKVLAELTT
jgi:luciferase family oxidoreductase group 1